MKFTVVLDETHRPESIGNMGIRGRFAASKPAPVLTGTVHQIAWARQIRDQINAAGLDREPDRTWYTVFAFAPGFGFEPIAQPIRLAQSNRESFQLSRIKTSRRSAALLIGHCFERLTENVPVYLGYKIGVHEFENV